VRMKKTRREIKRGIKKMKIKREKRKTKTEK
jgi:hypothetical protein